MGSTSGPKSRPLSPFMIGPYYKPQLTSMLSITHRATGVFLSFAALAFVWWLTALAAGPDAYRDFMDIARGPIGLLVFAATVFSFAFHFWNGLRHLMWDTGYGLDIPTAYKSGWFVLVISIVTTIAILFFALGDLVGGGA